MKRGAEKGLKGNDDIGSGGEIIEEVKQEVETGLKEGRKGF